MSFLDSCWVGRGGRWWRYLSAIPTVIRRNRNPHRRLAPKLPGCLLIPPGQIVAPLRRAQAPIRLHRAGSRAALVVAPVGPAVVDRKAAVRRAVPVAVTAAQALPPVDRARLDRPVPPVVGAMTKKN